MSVIAPRRPRRTYETGVVTRILRVVALLGWLGVTIVVLRRYPALPEMIPTRLGLGGDVDAVGPRWTVLVLLGVLWVVLGVMTWLSRRSASFTYPVAVTTENAQGVYREGERQVVWVNLALVPVGAGALLLVLGDDAVALLWAGLVLVVAAVVLGAVRAGRAGRAGRLEETAVDRAGTAVGAGVDQREA